MLDSETHESLLNELLDAELETSRKTEILQQLRVAHVDTVESVEKMTEDIDKLSKDNQDLIISNSRLFREMGIVGNEKKEEEVEQKEFSETVTIEELEKGE